MDVNEKIKDFDMSAPVEEFVKCHQDYGFEFPVRAGKLLKIFSSDGWSVLEDRQ